MEGIAWREGSTIEPALLRPHPGVGGREAIRKIYAERVPRTP